MKRILSMILAVLFSISNNVDYQTNSDMAFVPDGYFTIEENDPPDYRYLTQNYSNLTSSGNCVGKSASRQSAALIHMSELASYKYWFDYSDKDATEATVTSLGDDNSYIFSGDTDIVAPQALIVKTKSTDGGGHSMLLETTDGLYTIYVENMERWFCCRNRALPDDVDPMSYTWTHTSNVYGYTIPGGYMIGRATSGTTISIYNANGKPVSIATFYEK